MQITKEKAIIFCFGAAVSAYSITFKGNEGWAVSPALFCLVCGILICILSLFLADDKEMNKENTAKNFNIKSLAKPLLFVLCILVWSAALGKINFVLITAALLIVLGIIMEKESLADNVIQAVLVSFAVYFIFNTLFKVRL